MRHQRTARRRGVRCAAAAVPLLTLVSLLGPSAAWADADVGDSVWIGSREGYGGTGAFPIFSQTPADPSQPGTPDYWAYCIEHDLTPEAQIEGQVGALSDYLGANYFVDPAVQGMVLWVLAHSYPAVGLSEFGAAAGVPDIARNDALEATQYAIWRYTELDYDAPWAWETPESEAAYWYLVDGANASGGMTPGDFSTSVSITPPPGPQEAGSLVGPFVVHTNRPTARVSATPAVDIVARDGTVIDPDAVVDGQELYLDLRQGTAAGAATLTASVVGSSAMGRVISVPTTPGGTATAGDHAQTIILVAPESARTTATADARWAARIELAATGADPTGVWLAVALMMLGLAASGISRRRTGRQQQNRSAPS